MNRKLLVTAIVATTILAALLDLWNSAQLIGSILFTLPLALCAMQHSKRLLWGTAATVVLLTVVAEFWRFNRAELLNPWIASINRALLIACLLTLTGLIHFLINQGQKIVFDTEKIERQRSNLIAQNEQLEIAFTAATRDIAVRKVAEEHAVQMEARYRALLEAAPDAMVVVNQSGEIVLLNLQAEQQFGYYRDELLGQQVRNIIPEGFSERLIADGSRTAAEALTQQIGEGIELSGRRKDGSEFPIEIMLSPLENAGGILVTAAIRDITQRKKSEGHLVKTAGELKRSNDQLEQFAYIASHDLQEPLRMVASYTQLLAKRYQGRLDSDADEFITYAVDGCNRMQGLIRDLLAYSRSGTESKLLREISGEAALKEALANLRVSIEESGAVVTHDLLPAITTHDTQLVQLFQNLIGNAIKYRGGAVPHVHISATKNVGKEWIFSVRDNGLGISPQYFERIFVIFQRLHGRQEFNGNGIGLAICKKIVERMGGRIWVESQLEKGSTFYFSLPETTVNDGTDRNGYGDFRTSVG